jgi:hypothetical protein
VRLAGSATVWNFEPGITYSASVPGRTLDPAVMIRILTGLTVRGVAELAGYLRLDERHVISRDQLRAACPQVGNACLAAGNAFDLRLGDVKPAFLGGTLGTRAACERSSGRDGRSGRTQIRQCPKPLNPLGPTLVELHGVSAALSYLREMSAWSVSRQLTKLQLLITAVAVDGANKHEWGRTVHG